MGERKDAIPLRRKRTLQIRAAVALATLVGGLAYYSFGGSAEAGASHGASSSAQVPRRASAAVHASGGGGGGVVAADATDDGVDVDDAGHDDALDGGGGGGAGGGGVAAVRERPSMSIPEFAFAGKWGPSKATATLVESQEVRGDACRALYFIVRANLRHIPLPWLPWPLTTWADLITSPGDAWFHTKSF
jgi:hypothetical protein